MIELKPNWKIAQQISKRHTFISLCITIPILLTLTLSLVIILKILGYEHPGITLRQFVELHHQSIVTAILFFHLVPVNFYAIIRVFRSHFPAFDLKIICRSIQNKA